MGLTCITPFINLTEEKTGDVLLRTNSLSSMLKYIVKSIPNEKYLVNSPEMVFEKLFSLIDFDNVTILKNSKSNSLNFKKGFDNKIVCFNKVSFVIEEEIEGKLFDVYTSKKFVKFNSLVMYETNLKPFDMYIDDGHYHLSRNGNICRKMQFKIYP